MTPPARGFSIRVLAGGLGRRAFEQRFGNKRVAETQLAESGWNVWASVVNRWVEIVSLFYMTTNASVHAASLRLGTFKRHSPLVPILAGGRA
jgi:hypothetical protein